MNLTVDNTVKTWFKLLYNVYDKEPDSVKDLYHDLYDSTYSGLLMVKRFKEKGLIRTEPHEKDGRKKKPVLTDDGRRLLRRFRDQYIIDSSIKKNLEG